MTRLYMVFFISAVAAPGQAPARSVATSTFRFPPVGLAQSETAQVNVVNTATAVSGAPAPSCTGTVSFYNAGGTMIGTAAGFTVGSGQIFSATLPYDGSGGTGSRITVQAQIAITLSAVGPANSTSSAPPPACLLESSLETWDTSSGATHVFYARPTPQLLPNLVHSHPMIPLTSGK